LRSSRTGAMMQPFKVSLDDAKNFAKVWTYNGIAMPLDGIHCQFATDYANVAIRSFIEYMTAQAKARAQAAEEAARPKITLET
jgi:hypothetical protein